MQDITEHKQTEAELLAAIEAVMRDTSWFGQKVMEKLASFTRRGTEDRAGPAGERSDTRGREVLGLMAQASRTMRSPRSSA